ncbi:MULTISPECIES: 50S ribosomal protein L7ae family protein [unclassified Thermotoga]|uniref:50S ribosomal protein L7ae family protein n=1 Tax=unclassified Thermotoga TaxID=2631113 RepID=UPI000280E8A5|nr:MULTISPECIES: 50S ribosomal protein L7ae family protein [unclassified Thermotoga]AIY85705.1 ribosomal protein L7Ae/L30e/S12e/Gadd45 [Thermotoga sp. 2812B]EJX26486.1 ribosomal protein L7Ae/L30e/S12e/Gadd45 [Thermotoga sp. EMP]
MEDQVRRKVYSYIGFAVRARKIVFGKERMRAYIRSPREKKLIIIAEDASERTKRDTIMRCENKKVPYVIMFSKEELGRLLDKPAVSVIGLEEDNLIDAILGMVK